MPRANEVTRNTGYRLRATGSSPLATRHSLIANSRAPSLPTVGAVDSSAGGGGGGGWEAGLPGPSQSRGQVDHRGRCGVRRSVRGPNASSMPRLPHWGRIAGLTLLTAAAGWGHPAGGQVAQAIRVPHDSGVSGPTVTQGSATHRVGPPASVRARDGQLEQSVPAQFAPPAGMCRVWVHGVPPQQQPAPTQCAKAVRVRAPNSRVVFGTSKPTTHIGLVEGSSGTMDGGATTAAGSVSPGPGGTVVTGTRPSGTDRGVSPGLPVGGGGGGTSTTAGATPSHPITMPAPYPATPATPPIVHSPPRAPHPPPPPPPAPHVSNHPHR